MKYAEIKDGVVHNIVIADEEFAVLHNLIAIPDNAFVDNGYIYDGSSFIKPTPAYTPETLSAVKDSVRRKLKGERAALISQPINNIQVATQADRENVQGAIDNWDTLLGAPASINWTMADNTVQALTKADLQAVQDSYIDRRFQAHAIYQSLLADLEVASDPESVVWPV